MRFNCGPTAFEKFLAEHQLIRDGEHPYQQWHDHFAFFPTRVGNGDCRWLEIIQRIGWYSDVCGWQWEYRAKP
jgi:hypothetical protein